MTRRGDEEKERQFERILSMALCQDLGKWVGGWTKGHDETAKTLISSRTAWRSVGYMKV